MKKYENTTDTRICGPNDSNSDIIKDGKVDNSTSMQACRFVLDKFREAGCTKENDFGFKNGQPCIVLSLNRLIGWKPENYDGDIPKEVAGRYKNGNIAFNCDGTVSLLFSIILCSSHLNYYSMNLIENTLVLVNIFHQKVLMVDFTHMQLWPIIINQL